MDISYLHTNLITSAMKFRARELSEDLRYRRKYLITKGYDFGKHKARIERRIGVQFANNEIDEILRRIDARRQQYYEK